jgi:UDP-N-acetylmuramate dehydrogenase
MIFFDAYLYNTGRSFHGVFKKNEPMGHHSYYRIGGVAQQLIFPKNKIDCDVIADYLQEVKLPFVILGQASNVLISDAGYQGVVIKLNHYERQCAYTDGLLTCSASLSIPALLARACKEGYCNVDCLTGIPGSLGGAVFMNAGTTFGAIKDNIHSVTVFDIKSKQMYTYQASEMQFSYRKNHFLLPSAVILEVVLKTDRIDPKTVATTVQERYNQRKKTQPVQYPSCGSVFKNPSGMKAWQLIDQVGLRGYQLCDAQFSPMHPNFIINLGKARSQDVRTLIQLAQAKVHDVFKVKLEEEVIYIGDFV